MPARILDGRDLAERTLEEIRAEVASRPSGRRAPGLAAVLVGDDPASRVYVRNKIQACERCGIVSRLEHLPAASTERDVARVLEFLNDDATVDGILLQLPLPAGLPEKPLLLLLSPRKDVDGLHPVNLGKLVTEDPSGFRPCTPAGILELLAFHGIETEGRNTVVLGRSTLVGKPLALLLLQRSRRGNATVTVAHTQSRDVPELVRRADLLVAAVGSPRFVQGGWIRPGATVVDVGIHRTQDGAGGTRLVGDVDFASAVEVAGAITPVPGGVGRMTVAMLLRNTVLSWNRRVEALRVPSD